MHLCHMLCILCVHRLWLKTCQHHTRCANDILAARWRAACTEHLHYFSSYTQGHSIDKHTVRTTLQPPIVALDYVTHLAVLKGGWEDTIMEWEGVTGTWALRAHANE